MSSDDKKSRDARDEGATPEAEGSERRPAKDDDSSPEPSTGPSDTDTEETAQQPGEELKETESEETPAAEDSSEGDSTPVEGPSGDEQALEPKPAPNTEPRKPPTYYDDYDYQSDDPHAESSEGKTETAVATRPASQKPPPPPAPPGGGGFDGEDDEDGMARMSFLQHLDELRTRILHSLYGLGAVYLACLIFAPSLYELTAVPFQRATQDYDPPLVLTQLQVTEGFYLMYLKIPLVFGVLVASPWLMYQAWSFISPGLYKRERRWALPFILSTAGLFILGAVFGYFIALRFAVNFLVGVGIEQGIQPMISVDSYFNTGIAIILGLGVVFQMPVVIFFLTLIRLVTPEFLLNNVRYAILIIFVLAAAITPTPDVFNMVVFAGPMILLFYVGIFASYLLVLSREGRKMPARVAMAVILVLLIAALAGVYYLIEFQGFQFVRQFPWLVQP